MVNKLFKMVNFNIKKMKNKKDITFFEEKAQELRFNILNILHHCKAGHAGGALSIVEILVALYFKYLNINPRNPGDMNRDRFILSKGHASIALYSVLAMRGFFNPKILKTFDMINSKLQSHPDMNKVLGVEYTTGSLGQGLSVGVGMALGLRKLNLSSKVYILTGDGEINEGQIWEAMLVADKYRLTNIVHLIDRNKLQLSGYTKDILGMKDLPKKLSTFGFKVYEADGHDFNSIFNIFNGINRIQKDDMNCIILNTVKGKGVSFMENSIPWHGGKVITENEFKLALNEINYKGKEGIWLH